MSGPGRWRPGPSVMGVIALPQLLLDSLEGFWSVTDQLANGQVVSWDALFETSGYRALAGEFPPPALRSRFELVFAPDGTAEAQGQAQRDWLVAHYLRVRAERPAIQAFVAGLDAPALFGEAMRLASAWLPPGDAAPPAVALAIFDADARSYDPVVVDAAFARDLGTDNLVLLLAHEFHHWYRSRAGAVLSAGDLAWVLDQIQAEGIADLINVPAWLGEPGLPAGVWPGWAARYRGHLAEAPAFLTEMDRILQQMARSPESAAAEAQRLRAMLPMSGHPIGYHMAGRIVAAGLRDALTATCADPVAFFRLYAQAGGGTCELSDAALAYLTTH